MKQGIHPEYAAATIHCACGNVIETKSTTPGVIQVEICSACHPFFTGKQKLLDTAGRIDRFEKKYGSKVALGNQKKRKKEPVPAAPAPEPKKMTADPKQALKEKFAPKK